MERIITVCRELVNAPDLYLILGKVRSRKANKYVVYVSGSIFYTAVCNRYDEKYGVDQKEPYLKSKAWLFKAIRKAYQTSLKSFSVNKGRYGVERVYRFEDLKRILSKDPPFIRGATHRTEKVKRDIILDKLDYIISLLKNKKS